MTSFTPVFRLKRSRDSKTKMDKALFQVIGVRAEMTSDSLKTLLLQQESISRIISVETVNLEEGLPWTGIVHAIADTAMLEVDLKKIQLVGKFIEYKLMDTKASASTNVQSKDSQSFDKVIDDIKKLYNKLNTEEMSTIYQDIASMMVSNGKINLSAENQLNVGQKLVPILSKLSSKSRK